MKLDPYIFFDGRCAEALKFYEKLMGAKVEQMMPYGDMARTPDLRDKIMHANVKIGESTLMASDDGLGTYKTPQGYRVSLSVDTPAEAERIFAGLSEGGSVMMPLAETFFSQRFGMLTDKYGIPWMVNCEKQN
jgi:PhnB protein